MKYDIKRILKVTGVNILCLFIGSSLGGMAFLNPFAGLVLGVYGIIIAWPALILAAVYTEYLLNKQAAEKVNNELPETPKT